MPWADRCLRSVLESDGGSVGGGLASGGAGASDGGSGAISASGGGSAISNASDGGSGATRLENPLGSDRLCVDALVVDNGSSDGSVQYIREHFPSVRVVESGSNLGFGGANNIGLRIACEQGYDFAYLLNQDAWLLPGTLAALVAASSEDFPLISPIQISADGRLDPNFRRKCAPALRKAGALNDSLNGGNAPQKAGDELPQIVEVPFVMAAHWLLRISTIRTVGGFSPAFKQYGEDDNFIQRLRYFGLRPGVVPGAKAVHDRADRPDSKERRMRLKSLSCVVRLSNPCRPFAVSAVLEPLRLVGTALKNSSAYPLRYLPELLSRYCELRRLRAQSKRKGAFL